MNDARIQTCQRTVVQAALGGFIIFGTLVAHSAPVTTQGTWWGTDASDGALQARDIDGNAVALSSADAVFLYHTVL